MLEYDIFPGIAREGNLVAATVYFPEDYPGKLEYGDYLLERHDYLSELIYSDAVRVISVPFSRGSFERWLESNPCWKKADSATKAHSAWALDVAKSPQTLADLFSERPYLPAPPLQEKTNVLVIYGIVPTVIHADAATNPMSGRLPRSLAELVHAEFQQYFSACPPFRQLGELRCSGLKIHVGDRFVAASALDEFEVYALSETVKHIQSPLLHVPRHCRVNVARPDGPEGEALLTFSLLPVVLVGSGVELDYCEGLIRKNDGFVSNKVDSVLSEYARHRLGVAVDGVFPFFPAEEALFMMEQAISSIDEDDQDCPEYPGQEDGAGKRKNQPGHLTRLK